MSPPSTVLLPDRRRVLVVAALIEEGGRVLMSRRRADQSLPLCWEFPGGKIEPGESPEQALSREIREELGCDILVGRIYEVVFYRYDAFDLYMLVYACAITSGTPYPREVDAVEWVEKTRIPTLKLPPADIPLAQRLARES